MLLELFLFAKKDEILDTFISCAGILKHPRQREGLRVSRR